MSDVCVCVCDASSDIFGRKTRPNHYRLDMRGLFRGWYGAYSDCA